MTTEKNTNKVKVRIMLPVKWIVLLNWKHEGFFFTRMWEEPIIDKSFIIGFGFGVLMFAKTAFPKKLKAAFHEVAEGRP